MNALILVIPTLLNGQHEQGAAATTQRVLDGLKRPDLASDFDEWASPNHSESAPQSNAKAPSAWQLQIASLVEQLLVDNISTCSQTHLGTIFIQNCIVLRFSGSSFLCHRHVCEAVVGGGRVGCQCFTGATVSSDLYAGPRAPYD
jgi:hypothetical protein